MQQIRYSLELIEPAGAALSHRQLDVGEWRIGRGATCAVRVDANGVSREHVEVSALESGGCVVTDLGSTNGTRLDGRRVQRAAVSGDFVLDLGSARIYFREHRDEPAGLGYSTGMSAPAAGSEHPAQVEGTRALDLLQSLRDSAWQAVPETMRAGLGAALSTLLMGWLRLLDASGLVLQRAGGGIVAAAGDSVAATENLCESGNWRLDTDPATAVRLGPLREMVRNLLGALPDGVTSDGNDGTEPPRSAPPGVKTANRTLQRQLDALARVARSRVSILLLGETGVGKELLARWTHEVSPRAKGPFVAINCAALPRDLLEAELFGVERGAATGVEARPGVFERAHGGSLFLDELGDMPTETQVRLLRALEDGRIHRVGAQKLIEVDVRLIGATNRNLDEEVEAGRFRRDLYHRLAGFEARVPALRERREDIAALAVHWFMRALSDNALSSPGISAAALACLQNWHWPGNIRELRQAIESATAMLHPGEVLDRIHLPPRVAAQCPTGDAANSENEDRADAFDTESGELQAAVMRAEREAILRALEQAEGDHERAWQRLGIGKTTFYKKLRQLGIARGRDGAQDSSA